MGCQCFISCDRGEYSPYPSLTQDALLDMCMLTPIPSIPLCSHAGKFYLLCVRTIAKR